LIKLAASKRLFVTLGISGLLSAKLILTASTLPALFEIEGGAQAAGASTSEPVKDEGPVPIMLEERPEEQELCTAPEVLFQSIQKERGFLAEQYIQMDERKAEIALAEAKLKQDKRALEELRLSLEALLVKAQKAQSEDLDRLVQFYQNMKPVDAARIMDGLDIEVTILVLIRMKPRDAAPIMAKMTAVRARAVSKIILERSRLPGDQDLEGIRLK